jgi:translation initiation factor IF-3
LWVDKKFIKTQKDFFAQTKEDVTSAKNFRVNERIRVPEVRVVDHDGAQLGIMQTTVALDRAYDQGYDLVEVAPIAKPPVVRIMDFSKFKYEQEKREREAKKKQHIIHIKTIRLKPMIEQHDYETKIKKAEKFLLRGDKVKVSMMFRGRQMVHTNKGRDVMERFGSDLAPVGEMSNSPKLDGRVMVMVIIPKKTGLN